ncbi:MAG: 4Fe-4S dicluster domain-containing protein [Planctomycetota bacterium]|jgi:Na+-transporting NADH:ubiquinone oxidoreductase subunit A
MRFKGGYNILLKGKPDGAVKLMPEPNVLYLPLRSRRFAFSEVCVEDGQKVDCGDILARDPQNHAVPLLAPRTGTVRLTRLENHIVLEDIAYLHEHADLDERELSHIVQEMGAAGIKRYKLLSLGAWQFFYDAYTADLQLHNRLLNFTRGLEQLQSLLEYQPIYLVLPAIKTDFADLVRNQIRGRASVKMLEIPLTYPYDHFAILARRLGLKRADGPIWAVRAEGVLAVDRALTLTRPCTARIVSIGGISVNSPTHIRVMPGYPIKKIIDKYVFEPTARIIKGGILTGEPLGDDTLGLDAECKGITVLPELEEREFLGFVRPGWNRSCYANCFLSSLRDNFSERFSTGVRGEGRPCISCNFCEEVCPAGIMPYLIHKYLYGDLIEEAEQARVDLCVECGLCSFVCPSKIDLANEFIEAKRTIEKEKEEIRREEEKRRQLLEEKSSEKVVPGV